MIQFLRLSWESCHNMTNKRKITLNKSKTGTIQQKSKYDIGSDGRKYVLRN